MEIYQTEEQQVEAIKKFWKDNGTAIIIGAVIGLGSVWGRRYYNDSLVAAKETASVAYQELVTTLADGTDSADTDAFIAAQSNTGYAPLASFIAAQQAVEKADFAAAITQLEAAIASTQDAILLDIANLRLARVRFAVAEYTQALAQLDAVQSPSFTADKEALRGDVFVAQGEFQQASTAYTASLAAKDDNNVKMRLDNLAQLIDQTTQTTGQ